MKLTSQTITNIAMLLPKIRKLCDHKVNGTVSGDMCACAGLTKLVEVILA